MATVKVFNMSGSEVGNIELNDSIFAVEVNEHVMHQAVVQYLANQRQGTQSTLTRAEVRGGGRKPWRQKGTGRARQGSIRSPQWTGGGVVFAPKPRDYSFKLNKKVKRIALKSALTTKVNEGKLIVIDELNLAEAKTKNMVAVLKNVSAVKPLIILEEGNNNAVISARNIADAKTAGVNAINVYDILKYDTVVVTKAAVSKIEEVYA
jgi:large subunit ribosomal protein L4